MTKSYDKGYSDQKNDRESNPPVKPIFEKDAPERYEYKEGWSDSEKDNGKQK